jgi:uroporphyrin-III C-methyltransferase/precorrin-2 dehydrogenase/sirohydrochlorin ferrochelatase
MLTLRAVERLQSADIIFHDRLVDDAVLELARRDAERVAVGKAPGGIGWDQAEIDRAIVEAAREGLRVVRLKAGDPGVFGRAAEEVAALTEAGIAWEIVAGVTAASAAAAETGSFLTERGAIRAITLATGHTADGARPDWGALARPGSAVAFYMAVANAAEIEAELLADGVPGQLPVEIVENASRPGMRHVSCRLERLAETVRRERVRNPAILLLRWPEGASAVIPRAEERGAHPHIGGAKRDRLLEIATHSH